MAISYEEALVTLQAMFTEPWTRQSLDAVLRHEKGHMENTCDVILQHGDQDPQILVDRLKVNVTTLRHCQLARFSVLQDKMLCEITRSDSVV